MLEEFLGEIKKLQQAYKLLQYIYIEIGPYKSAEISDELWQKIKDFFNFDDSE